MSEKPKVVSPRFSQALNNKLKELKFSRSDFIRKFHRDHGEEYGARNHLFKIMNGKVFVGMEQNELLPMICETLGLDYEKMKQLVISDRIEHKDWGSAMPKASKTMQELATVMDTLTSRDQADVLAYARLRAHLS
jgi:hypothetical protein